MRNHSMIQWTKKLLWFALALGPFSGAFAISEAGYEAEYGAKVEPFLKTGQPFKFNSHDGLSLSGVRFQHPRPRGIVVVLNGRTETWLKYGETFYDLFQKGLSVYS